LNKAAIFAEDVRKYYTVKVGFRKKAEVKAVDGISLIVKEGESHCIVGESGSGKTTVSKLVLGLEPPSSGTLKFFGEDLKEILVDKDKLRNFRKSVQAVFQDPYSSLNPRKTVKEILEKPFKVHHIEHTNSTIETLLQDVGMTPPQIFLDRYVHQISGGQRQRVCIARALALKPKIVTLDEPTAALDVTIKAQILNLLIDLKSKYNLTYVIISHELPLLKGIADKITVMYAGKVIEQGPAKNVFNRPHHPYTIGLLESIPPPDPKTAKGKSLPVMEGEPPSPVNPPPGCRFHTRCPFATDICRKEEPKLSEVEKEHFTACFHLRNVIQ